MPEWIGDNLDKVGFADRMMDGNIAVGGRIRAVTDRMIMATKGKDGASVRKLRAVQREFLRGIEAAAKARSKAKAESMRGGIVMNEEEVDPAEQRKTIEAAEEEEGVTPREYSFSNSDDILRAEKIIMKKYGITNLKDYINVQKM